jgi:hypothetical protein
MQRSPQGRHRTDVRCLGKFMASMMPRGYKDPRVRVGGVPSYTPVSLADCFDVLRENEPAIYATVAEHDPRNNPITEPSPAATGRRSSSSDARARAAAVRRDAGGLFDAGTAALHALRDGDYDLATALLEVEQQGDIF